MPIARKRYFPHKLKKDEGAKKTKKGSLKEIFLGLVGDVGRLSSCI